MVQAVWRAENVERIRAYHAIYTATHRERKAAYDKVYRTRNRQEIGRDPAKGYE
jgi:hypothetical protein